MHFKMENEKTSKRSQETRGAKTKEITKLRAYVYAK